MALTLCVMPTDQATAPLIITTENFQAEVTDADVPVLLEFWATWCIPCNLMKRAVSKAAEALGETAKVGLVNVDQEPDLIERYGIKSTPTFLLVNKGEVLESFSGMTTTGNIVSKVRQQLS